MIDPIIERRVADMRELLQLWNSFHKYFAIAVKGGEYITPDRETEFLQIKSRIAMLHDTFMGVLKHDQDIGQHVLSLVERSITLKHIHRLSVAEINKMQIEWHESYLLLSEMVASLEEQAEVISNINPTTYRIQKTKEKAILHFKNFVVSIWFKVILIAIGIPILFTVVNHIWSFSNLKKYKLTRKPYNIAVKYWRYVNPNIPFENTSEIPRKKGNRPAELEAESVNLSQQTATSIITQPDLKATLLGSNIQFSFEAYKYKNSRDKLFIMFFLSNEEDSNDKMQEFMDNFLRWKNSLSAPERKNIEDYNDIFRINNVIIIISSTKSADRKTIKELEFGVMD